jgi:hypothetical protein
MRFVLLSLAAVVLACVSAAELEHNVASNQLGQQEKSVESSMSEFSSMADSEIEMIYSGGDPLGDDDGTVVRRRSKHKHGAGRAARHFVTSVVEEGAKVSWRGNDRNLMRLMLIVYA